MTFGNSTTSLCGVFASLLSLFKIANPLYDASCFIGGDCFEAENNGNMRKFMGSSIENQTPIENEADLWATRNGAVGLSCHQITSKAEGKVKCIFLAHQRPATLTHSTVQTDRMCAAGEA